MVEEGRVGVDGCCVPGRYMIPMGGWWCVVRGAGGSENYREIPSRGVAWIGVAWIGSYGCCGGVWMDGCVSVDPSIHSATSYLT